MKNITLYKDTNGLFVFDSKYTPTGSICMDLIDDGYLQFSYAATGEKVFDQKLSLSNILDINGNPYATYDLLKDQLTEFISNTSLGGSQLKSFSVVVSKPASITAYSAGDVVADLSGTFTPIINVAKNAGSGVRITRVRIQLEDVGAAGTKFNLHVYNQAPTFIADNGAFSISYANAAKRVGAIPVIIGTGNLNTVGSNDWNSIVLNPVSKDIYFILETVTGYTPVVGMSNKIQITIDCELSNN